MVITSLENAKIIEAARLSEKKYRVRTGLYLIEGARLVSDAVKHGAEIVDVFVGESVADKYSFDGQIVVTDRVFAKISDTVNSQGVAAVVRKKNAPISAPKGNCLVLDGVRDPGNVGTLIRTAVACGFTDVYAVDSADVYSPKVIRSAMSAHFCINLHETKDIEEVFSLLQNATTVAADMHGENVFQTRFTGQTALILGNEANGLSAFSKAHAQKMVALPMANEFESLNVAVAGSVIAYQIFSQNN